MPATVRRLILRSFQSPGDAVVLTAAVRDLLAAYPGRFQIDVRTSAPAIWQHNPRLTPLREESPGVETIDMHYPLIHHSNARPYHFLHGYVQYLEQRLAMSPFAPRKDADSPGSELPPSLRIPITQFRGELFLSDDERAAPPHRDRVPDRFWIVVAGGKYDFTAKWWDPAAFQAVVDHFRGRIAFVQCGEAGHWHPPLKRVVNLVGRTSLREFIRLVHHADGILCPVTLAMHLAAAVPTRPDKPPLRPCVVVAGGREPAHWEVYPGHQFLSNVGTLPCCASGGCWKSRCQTVGDGDDRDRANRCEHPVPIGRDVVIPLCMSRITPADVIRRIEMYDPPLI